MQNTSQSIKPLLLHVGPEYAIPSSDPRTTSYDFLSWTFWDKIGNFFRGANKWQRPQVEKIHENLRAGLGEGAIIIFAHCGLPYYAPNWLKRIFEHSDFKDVRRYLKEYQANSTEAGRCYADLSACVTPFRRSYYPDIRELPQESLLFGSDFPTPVFELSADAGEMIKDLTQIHRLKFVNPIFELAKLVREGYMKRPVALQKLSEPEILETVELVKKKLGL